jgi:predicted amidohydrolase YtcJ
MTIPIRWAVALGAAVGAACAGPAPVAELVLHHAKVFTADSAAPWAQAVLIRGDRIGAVGANEAVLGAASPNAVRVDLGGRTVVPGFNDTHDHIALPAPGVVVATLADPLPEPTWALVRDSLRAAVARAPAGSWLRVSVGERVLSDPAARRDQLDQIAPGHPVALEAWTGHGVVLNSAAILALGIEESTADPLGGRLDRRRDGRLTGLIEEYAGYRLWERRAPLSDSAVVAALRARAREVIGWGITSIQNMATGMPPELLGRVLDTLTLPIRLRTIRLPLTTPAGRDLAGWAELRGSLGSGVVVSGTKWVLDGTPVERLAVMRAPYSDRPGWHGRLNFPPDTLRALLRDALAANDQPLLHAVGDSAIGLALALMTELAPDSVWRRLRPRIEHGDGLSPDQYQLARRLGAVVVQNPSHLTLGPSALARLGPDRMRVYQPLRSLLRAGIPLALGSDGPLNPFLNLMFAVLHPDNPGEALTMEEAVRAYTAGSAFAEHAEGEKGRLAPGLVADLAVLSQDIFTIPAPTLPATVSELTLVAGKVIHDPEHRVGAGRGGPSPRPESGAGR